MQRSDQGSRPGLRLVWHCSLKHRGGREKVSSNHPKELLRDREAEVMLSRISNRCLEPFKVDTQDCELDQGFNTYWLVTRRLNIMYYIVQYKGYISMKNF